MSYITTTKNANDLPANWLARLTAADGALFLILLATAVSRFTNLGQIPLSPDEASRAWASWQFWQPGGTAVTGGSPAYFSLTASLLPFLGSSDAIARLIPALFGVGIVCLPWLLRKRLGAVGALVASLLLAISPTQAIISRTAGGDAIALFALMLIVVGWLRYEDASGAIGNAAAAIENRWLTAIFAGLALGLTSSPLFYGGLLALAIAGWPRWRVFLGRGLVRMDGDKNPFIPAIIIFIALSSLFLWHLSGLGAAAALPAQWLQQFRFAGDGLFDPILAFMRYEPFLLLSGVTAVTWAILTQRKRDSWAVRASWAIIVIIILMLMQRGQMSNVALLVLPAALLVGQMADTLFQTRPSRIGWAWAGGLLFLLGVIFVNLARYARVITIAPQDFTSAWVMLLAVTAVLVTLYFVGVWEGTAVTQGSFLAVLAFFIFYQWGVGWQLTHTAANDPRQRWVTTATDDDVRLLAANLQDISRQTTGADHDITVFSSVDSPALRWYLRHFNQIQFGDSLPVGAQHEAIISPNRSDLTLGSDYAGADYGLLRDGLLPEEIPSDRPGIDWLRWQLFNESSRTIREERVILWWRADLSENGG